MAAIDTEDCWVGEEGEGTRAEKVPIGYYVHYLGDGSICNPNLKDM